MQIYSFCREDRVVRQSCAREADIEWSRESGHRHRTVSGGGKSFATLLIETRTENFNDATIPDSRPGVMVALGAFRPSRGSPIKIAFLTTYVLKASSLNEGTSPGGSARRGGAM